jgi:hypothetical protein
MTAKEFLKERRLVGAGPYGLLVRDPSETFLHDLLAEFAKMHVIAAVRALTEAQYDRATTKQVNELTEEALKHFYPLQNIK